MILKKQALFRWQTALLSAASLLVTGIVCLEENQPAIFLSPRNFNPHPYQTEESSAADVEERSITNRGPVVFPPSPPEENPGTNRIVSVASHPIDDHPYPKIVRKHKYKLAGRFNEQDNYINPRVYAALSDHATKVLSESPRLGNYHTLSSLENEKKNYAFSYKVVDHITGDDFSHTQSQNARATNGEYRVKLPDGRVQIVSYIADKNGYKADVKYAENQLPSRNVQQNARRTAGIPILKAANSFDYRTFDNDAGGGGVVLQDYGGDDGVPVVYQQTDYQTVTPSSYPKSIISYASPENVHIYTTQGGINKFGNYLSSTVAPLLIKSAISSTIAPNLDGYSKIYVSTPKFHIVQNQKHEEIYGK